MPFTMVTTRDPNLSQLVVGGLGSSGLQDGLTITACVMTPTSIDPMVLGMAVHSTKWLATEMTPSLGPRFLGHHWVHQQ